MATGKRRVGIQINVEVYDKLLALAERYGMTVNSLIAYILGQWADSNYDMKEKMTDKVIQEMAKQVMDLENNPLAAKMVKEVMAEVMVSVKEQEEQE